MTSEEIKDLIWDKKYIIPFLKSKGINFPVYKEQIFSISLVGDESEGYVLDFHYDLRGLPIGHSTIFLKSIEEINRLGRIQRIEDLQTEIKLTRESLEDLQKQLEEAKNDCN